MPIDEARVLKFEKQDAAATWNELRPREKQCLILAVAEGKSFREISRKMGICETYVATLVQTATRILRIERNSTLRTLAFWMGLHWKEICESENHERSCQARIAENSRHSPCAPDLAGGGFSGDFRDDARERSEG